MCRKKVYLTIDDGPSKDFNNKIDFLSEKTIPAIFFCLGENLILYHSDVIKAVRKGFIIGNHSFNHTHFSDMSLDACKDSIWKADQIIDSIYQESGIARRFKLFRFPYFDQGGDSSGQAYEMKISKPPSEWFIYSNKEKRMAIQSFLKESGYIQPAFKGINTKFFIDNGLLQSIDIRCTFDQMEYFLGRDNAPYGMSTEEAILGRIDEDVPYLGRSLNRYETSDIILIHDEERTTALFYKIITRYLEKDFEFMGLENMALA